MRRPAERGAVRPRPCACRPDRHPRLDEACDKFQDEWKYGSDKTKELIDEIKDGVKANKKGYEEVEEALEKALKQIADKSTSGGNEGRK